MKRRRIPEVMDGSGIDSDAHAHALRSLNRINRALGMDRRLLGVLTRIGGANGSILDLGCGGGGLLGFLADQRGLDGGLLFGVDRSAYALNCAARWQRTGIHWIAADACKLPLPDKSLDVVTCSLFLHHLDEQQAISVLREAGRVARDAIIVADLVRSRLAWVLTWIVTRLLSRSWIFQVDGPRSVLAAYRPGELADLAKRAGMADATMGRCFPFRMVLTWNKPPHA